MTTFCYMHFHCDQLTTIRQEMNIFISSSNNCLMANTKNRFQLSLVRKDKNKTLKIIISFCCQTLRNWAPYYAKGLNSCASQRGLWRSPQLPSNYIFLFFFFFFQNKIAILTPFKSSLVPFRAVVLNLFLVLSQILNLKVYRSPNQINENFQLVWCNCCWLVFF